MFGVLRPPSPLGRPVADSDGAPPPLPQSLAPMPPSEFLSREDLLQGTKDWTASQGYAVVIARSRANRLWLKCDRGGSYENRRNLTQDQRKRKRGESRLLGCPFRMLATIKRDGIWRVETDNSEHNHGPSGDLSMHPTLRRMNDEQLGKVHQMFDEGRSPAETVDELKATWPDIKVLTRDIYNARKKYKTQKEEAETLEPVKQPAPDPNGVFPGPDENGRWAWVPDGEEVTSKKSRRRKKLAPPPLATAPAANMIDETLDPLLQAADSTPQMPQPDALNSPQPQPEPVSMSDSFAEASKLAHDSDLPHLFNDSSDHPSNQTPSRLRSRREQTTMQEAADPVMTVPPLSNGSTTTTDGDSPTVLAARIARMEKEQRDQKNMLAQILGAVKGISPP